jgi:hypothetical protein
MRGLLISFIAFATAAGCAKDAAGPTTRPRTLADVVAARAQTGQGPRVGARSRLQSVEERALITRILARVPDGEARQALREDLDGVPGDIVQTRVEGNPELQSMLDSLSAMRGYGRRGKAAARPAQARSVRLQ